MSKYPILSPNVHYNELNEDLSILTDLSNINTKLLKKYHKRIIRECVGLLTVEEIKEKLLSDGVSASIVNQVDQYIDKMIEWGYLIWSPEKNYLSTNAGVIRENNDIIPSDCTVYPNGLHSITISILDSCCLHCGYCSQNAPMGKSEMLSLEVIRKLLSDAYELGARYFGVFGGEPMLHPDIFEVIQSAYQLGYRTVYMFTRGTLIDHEKAKKLRSVGINKLQLTVDSHIPDKYDAAVNVPGAFNKMFKGLFYLQDVGIEIVLKIIVTSENINDVMDTVLFFKDAGVKTFSLESVLPVGRADFDCMPSYESLQTLKKNIDELKYNNSNLKCSLTFLQYGKPKQCGAGVNSIFVFADGETGPCDKSHYLRQDISFGNIHEKSLKEIWKSNGPSLFRRLRNNDIRCKQCNLSETCLGGCFLNSYIETGHAGADPMCSRISGKSGGLFPHKG